MSSTALPWPRSASGTASRRWPGSGSVARGAGATSDVDILYVLAPDVRLGFAVNDLEDELAALLGRPVDLVSKRALHRLIRDESSRRLRRCVQHGRLLLAEIIDAGERIIELGSEASAADLCRDRNRREALLWNFTVLSEAVDQLSDEVKAERPEIAVEAESL
jgi:predicted nucleotidyltransferase